ncbi:MAG TPA: tRNA (adenosine(37)-N6)-dimethylallyltransferase MiaA [Parafilimonas sp.]
MDKEKTVIIIAGPTASGKTNISLELARYFNTSVISADSRQCYKELNIGVAKPSSEALHSIKHYFINSHSIQDNINAQVFEDYALKAADEIFMQRDIAVMVGGTGMYIKAFCEGLDEIPEVDAPVRNKIIKNYNEKGLSWLQFEVEKRDPLFWEHAERQNPQRLMRALEVINSTGISITKFRINKKQERPFKIIKIGIDISKEQLHRNIDARVDEMIKNGLVEEVQSLQAFEKLNALQTVGYKEIFDCMHGAFSIQEAISQIKTRTKQYAKRQLTWFKKDKSFHWLQVKDAKNFLLEIVYNLSLNIIS